TLSRRRSQRVDPRILQTWRHFARRRLNRKPYRHIRKVILTGELTYADPGGDLSLVCGFVSFSKFSYWRVHRRSERARCEDAIWTGSPRARRQDNAGRSGL